MEFRYFILTYSLWKSSLSFLRILKKAVIKPPFQMIIDLAYLILPKSTHIGVDSIRPF